MKPFGSKGILAVGLLWLTAQSPPALAGKQVVIVKSSDNTYFSQSTETLVSRVTQADGFRILNADQLDSEVDPEDDNLLLVAMGQKAVEAIDRLQPRAQSVNSYITHEQMDQLGIADQPTVLLDQPLHRYLAFSRLVVDIESLGIVVENQIQIDRRSAGLLADTGLQLQQYLLNEHNKLLPVLRQLLRQQGALLMLPRSRIYNRDSLKGVLLTGYRNRKPVISYSPAHVKAGALASIYSSPRDIGLQLAGLINRMLGEPGFVPPDYQYARYYSISTNPRVARALGLTLPDDTLLRSKLDRLEP